MDRKPGLRVDRYGWITKRAPALPSRVHGLIGGYGFLSPPVEKPRPLSEREPDDTFEVEHTDKKG